MSGERDGARDAIARVVKHNVEHGMNQELAKKKAVEAALRFDRQNPNHRQK